MYPVGSISDVNILFFYPWAEHTAVFYGVHLTVLSPILDRHVFKYPVLLSILKGFT